MKNFKKFLTLVLAVMMVVSSFAFSTSAATTKFEDVDADNEVLVEAVDLLNYMGVAKGKSETNFGTEEAVTREQFALFMYRLMNGGKDAPANSKDTAGFTDLEDPTYFYAIAWAKAAGIVNGKSASTFAPKDGITLQEAYAMITRALGWEEAQNLVYPYGHIEVAEQDGVELDNGLASNVGYTDALTRGDMAILLYNAFFAETAEERVLTDVKYTEEGKMYLEEHTTRDRLCEVVFDVVEVDYKAVATPHYQMGDEFEATYDLGYDAVYFVEVTEEDTDAPDEAYLTAEDLGLEAAELDDCFLGEFTVFVTLDKNDKDEIAKVLYADCNMVKKTVTELTLGEVSTNKKQSYFYAENDEGEEEAVAKLFSGKISAGEEDMYLFNAPYTYAKETYPTEIDGDPVTALDKYAIRNSKNLVALGFTMESDGDDDIYTAGFEAIVTTEVEEMDINPSKDDIENGYIPFYSQAEELLTWGEYGQGFKQVYYGGLYEADLYDVEGDGIYDYINYKPYMLFQVDADEEKYFLDDSDFTGEENEEFGIPYIYTQEATVIGEEFASEDVVIGYFSENLELVNVVAVVKPTVGTITNYSTRDGSLTLDNGEKVDGVSNWRMFAQYIPEEIVFDEDVAHDAVYEAEDTLFDRTIIDAAKERELYIYEGKLLLATEVNKIAKFTENLIIPTSDKEVKEGPFDPESGENTMYVYAYVDGAAKYVPVLIDEDIANPVVVDGALAEEYDDALCTYTESNGVYTIIPLEFALEDYEGAIVEEALMNADSEIPESSDAADAFDYVLNSEKTEEQFFVADLPGTVEKVAGSRFDIGFDRDVDLKSYTKIIIKVDVTVNEDYPKYEYVVYDATTFKKSLDCELANMKAIVSNNPGSKSRENLVLLYGETDEVEFAGTVDKTGYRIVSVYDIAADEDGKWRNYYELYDPFTGAKVTDVASKDSSKKSATLQAGLEPGTIIKLVDGMVDDVDEEYGEIDTANLVWITDVDEEEGCFRVVKYDDTLTVKDEIDEYVETSEAECTDIEGETLETNYVDFDKNTVVSVMSYGEYNDSFWKWGTMSLSNMSAVASAKRELLCYNDKAEDRSGNFVTKYADYVKAYVAVDHKAYDEEDETNVKAEYIIVIVNGDENAALDE